jgi:hypothetical protein
VTAKLPRQTGTLAVENSQLPPRVSDLHAVLVMGLQIGSSLGSGNSLTVVCIVIDTDCPGSILSTVQTTSSPKFTFAPRMVKIISSTVQVTFPLGLCGLQLASENPSNFRYLRRGSLMISLIVGPSPHPVRVNTRSICSPICEIQR